MYIELSVQHEFLWWYLLHCFCWHHPLPNHPNIKSILQPFGTTIDILGRVLPFGWAWMLLQVPWILPTRWEVWSIIALRRTMTQADWTAVWCTVSASISGMLVYGSIIRFFMCFVHVTCCYSKRFQYTKKYLTFWKWRKYFLSLESSPCNSKFVELYLFG